MAVKPLKGKVHKYGDNVDTDVIIPARYLNISDKRELGSHCLEDLDKNFVKNVVSGDFIVAGKNFGSGSSREQAVIAIKEAGVAAVIAVSFARIFFRNAINIGLPIIECQDAAGTIADGDRVEIDLSHGIIKDITQKKHWQVQPFPEFLRKIIDAGGLLNYVRSVRS